MGTWEAIKSHAGRGCTGTIRKGGCRNPKKLYEDVLGCMIACVHPKHMSIASRHIVRCDTLSGSVIKQQNKATIL